MYSILEWNKVFFLAAIILHNWSTVSQTYIDGGISDLN